MTVFLLGPSRDEAGTDKPLQARRVLADRIRRSDTPAVIMEEFEDRDDETNLAKFSRIEREHNVTTFAVLVPLASRLHGTSVEFGHLLTRIQEGRLDSSRVHLLLQTLLTRIDDEGVLALNEPGNRTRYYEDLLEEGCPVHRWTDWDELNRHAAAIALEDDLINRG